MISLFRFFLIISIASLMVHCTSSIPKKSIEDLKTAFNSESTSADKYSKFAEKARVEGFDTIATLFEAVSKSEAIHATNHVKVLEKYGEHAITPQIASFEVKTTAENIQSAFNTETYEMQTQYPVFIRDAENEKAAEAAKSFTWAWDAEKKHLSYFSVATTSLTNGSEKGLSFNWYVCPVCGNTYNAEDLKTSCDFCLTKQENFIGFTEKSE